MTRSHYDVDLLGGSIATQEWVSSLLAHLRSTQHQAAQRLQTFASVLIHSAPKFLTWLHGEENCYLFATVEHASYLPEQVYDPLRDMRHKIKALDLHERGHIAAPSPYGSRQRRTRSRRKQIDYCHGID